MTYLGVGALVKRSNPPMATPFLGFKFQSPISASQQRPTPSYQSWAMLGKRHLVCYLLDGLESQQLPDRGGHIRLPTLLVVFVGNSLGVPSFPTPGGSKNRGERAHNNRSSIDRGRLSRYFMQMPCISWLGWSLTFVPGQGTGWDPRAIESRSSIPRARRSAAPRAMITNQVPGQRLGFALMG